MAKLKSKENVFTKADFEDRFDFEALGKATEVRVHMINGDTNRVYVTDYWPTSKYLTDYLDGSPSKEGVDYVCSGKVNSEFEFQVPHPDIDYIEILSSTNKPNHGSHPEVGFNFIVLEDLYRDV